MSQQDTISRLKQGESGAFNEIVEQWKDMVYNTALSIVQQEDDADDITQEVFISMYEHIAEFRQEAMLSTWIYRITVRKALDHEKKKKRAKHGGLIKRIFSVREAEEPANFDHPGILLDNKERAAVLFRALKKLPEKQRIAFTLHKMEGLSHQEIATVMNTSLDAIESLQTRAKNNLVGILRKYYEQHL